MKILVISDLHGKTIGLEKAKEELNDVDRVVFIGDYCDSYTDTDKNIFDNLVNIIQFKKDNMDKVELLIGNHELHYIYSYAEYGASGFRYKMYPSLHMLFTEHRDLFKVSYNYKNYLFTHAGTCEKWYMEHSELISFHDYNLNNMLTTKKGRDALFQVGWMRGGMSRKAGGPLWCDKEELENNECSKTDIQVVGHSKVPEIIYTPNTIFTDCLDTVNQFLILDV